MKCILLPSQKPCSENSSPSTFLSTSTFPSLVTTSRAYSMAAFMSGELLPPHDPHSLSASQADGLHRHREVQVPEKVPDLCL